jgi:hypothetical protein
MQAKNELTRELPFELPYLFRTSLPVCLIQSALHRLHPFICPPTEIGLLLIDHKVNEKEYTTSRSTSGLGRLEWSLCKANPGCGLALLFWLTQGSSTIDTLR